ncbi:MAG: CaiB/BaiF CoA-transferase family protein [Proteobacteria bacterium]|nr:CaiB/BaiF CoA-transferase family protein [Pseudomonadota bacterium]
MNEQGAVQGPLNGLRILELGHFIAAPFATRVLADLGAEVIKIEPPGTGDPVRSWGEMIDGDPTSIWWSVHGRNKKSVTVNLRKPEGIEIVKKLIREVDAVVENFKPGQLAKWGLDADVIGAVNPDAILVQVSGYGQSGPNYKRAAFGVIGEAVGGIRHLTGYPKEESDLPPVRTGVSLGDSVAGLYAAIGLLAAMFEKLAGKRPPGVRVVDVALSESVLSLLEGVLPEYGYLNKIRQPQGSTIRTTAPSNAYPSKDGRWFLIGANSQALFERLTEAMRMPELAKDPRFCDNPSRTRNAAALDDEIAIWSRTQTLAEMEKLMTEADVPATRIYDIADISKDPQFLGRGMVRKVADERLGEMLHPGVVPHFPGAAGGGVGWAGPALGRHNDEILRGLLGLERQIIDKLSAAGVI